MVGMGIVDTGRADWTMVELGSEQQSAPDHNRLRSAKPDEYHTYRHKLVSDCLKLGPGSSAFGQFLEGPLNPRQVHIDVHSALRQAGGKEADMGHIIAYEDGAATCGHLDIRVTDMSHGHDRKGLVDQPHTVPDDVDAVVGCVHSG